MTFIGSLPGSGAGNPGAGMVNERLKPRPATDEGADRPSLRADHSLAIGYIAMREARINPALLHCRNGPRGSIMPHENSVGFVAGLVLLASVLAMIGSLERVSRTLRAPHSSPGGDEYGTGRRPMIRSPATAAQHFFHLRS
jgi:hypothetical protein